ncbi:MAG: hypothetical protein LBG57_04665 [Treponema sp.]|nr:hypothetical protein [Treponema sp.]
MAIGSLAAKGIEKAFGAIKTAIAGIPEFASRADEISKTGAKIGIATDTLQKYRYAGDLAGVSNETLNNALMTLNRNLGTGTLAASMGKIDKALTAQIAKAPGADAAFQTIAAAVSAETDATRRATLMNAAFGKSGAQLIPMPGDMSEQLKNAPVYGNIIPPGAITNAELFNDTVSRVKSMVQGFGDSIRSAALQYVTPLVIKLQDWIAANRELISTRIEEFISAAAGAVEWLCGMEKQPWSYSGLFLW